MAIAAFDYSAWAMRYPELSSVPKERAELLFAEAGIYLDNTDCSPITDSAQRLVYLNMVVAHLAALAGAGSGGVPSGLVGRVTEASEGSVTVKVDAGAIAGTAAWWAQTSYGYTYWAAAARFRVANYYPACQPSFEPLRGLPWT